MIIKKFQLFESNKSEDFPSLEEVKSYFYDFTDELNTFIDDYEFGYLYFNTTSFAVMQRQGIPLQSEVGMVNILDTEISNTQLEYNADFIKLNRDVHKEYYKNKIKLIESGEASGYDSLYIHFDQYLFDQDKLPILIDCLKTFYSQTEFRLVRSLWTEDRVDDTGNVVTFYGFEGNFVRVSDDEYKKMCQIFQQGNFTTTLTKLF